MLQKFVDAFSTFLAGDTVMSLYWGLAVAGTLFFLLILLFAGIGGVENPAEVSADGTFDSFDHVDTGFGDFQFLSLRTILAFVTIFGWSGVVWGKYGIWGFLAAFALGLVAMSLTALAVWAMMKMQHSGNVRPEDIVGKTGTVYLGIPARRNGQGKVTVAAGGSTRELTAVSDEELATGEPCRVLKVIDSGLYLVGKLS